jgi:hypothetical protein
MSRESRVSEHFTVQHSAIKMLSSRLAIIRDYVQAVESGKEEILNAGLRLAIFMTNIMIKYFSNICRRIVMFEPEKLL